MLIMKEQKFCGKCGSSMYTGSRLIVSMYLVELSSEGAILGFGSTRLVSRFTVEEFSEDRCVMGQMRPYEIEEEIEKVFQYGTSRVDAIRETLAAWDNFRKNWAND